MPTDTILLAQLKFTCSSSTKRPPDYLRRVRPTNEHYSATRYTRYDQTITNSNNNSDNNDDSNSNSNSNNNVFNKDSDSLINRDSGRIRNQGLRISICNTNKKLHQRVLPLVIVIVVLSNFNRFDIKRVVAPEVHQHSSDVRAIGHRQQRGLCSIRLPLSLLYLDKDHNNNNNNYYAANSNGVNNFSQARDDPQGPIIDTNAPIEAKPSSNNNDEELYVYLFQRAQAYDGGDADVDSYVDKFVVSVNANARQWDDEQLRSSRFVPHLATYVIIHGFRGSWSLRSWQNKIKNLILSSLTPHDIRRSSQQQRHTSTQSISTDGSANEANSSMDRRASTLSSSPSSNNYASSGATANVLIVDWSRMSRPARFEYDYPSAVTSSHKVGVALGMFIRRLIEATGADARLFHLIDPTGVCYDDEPDEHRLNKNDAQTVVVLHTNARTLGSKSNYGSYDIWVNGGLTQPGCARASAELLKLLTFRDASFACSHRRAHELISEPLDACQHVAYACHSYAAFQHGECGTCNDTQRDCVLTNLAEQISASSLAAWPVALQSGSLTAPVADKQLPPQQQQVDERAAPDGGDLGGSSSGEQRQYHLITSKSSPYCSFQYQVLIHMNRRWRYERGQRKPTFRLELVTSGGSDEHQQRHSMHVSHFHSRHTSTAMPMSNVNVNNNNIDDYLRDHQQANGGNRQDPRRRKRRHSSSSSNNNNNENENENENENDDDDDDDNIALSDWHTPLTSHSHQARYQQRSSASVGGGAGDLMSALLSVEWHEPLYKWLPARFVAANLSSSHQAALASVTSVELNFMSHSSGAARRHYSTRLCPLDSLSSSGGGSAPSGGTTATTSSTSSGGSSSTLHLTTFSDQPSVGATPTPAILHRLMPSQQRHDSGAYNNHPAYDTTHHYYSDTSDDEPSTTFLLSLLAKSLGATQSSGSTTAPTASRLFAISVSSLC
ncbi:Lipase member H [Fragariocoptes setiger]|uniref:Lipase member H n=1 Tax=Fragariocoptes setiger TaxID=1670756 RepID=A0ABQ7SBP6_9ACAR|nr:Lipase member H [Fragariocoptes setiger]